MDNRNTVCRKWLIAACIIGVLFANAFLAGSLWASDEDNPLETADTSSPRSTLKSFVTDMHKSLKNAKEGRRRPDSVTERALRNRILRCLDLSELPPVVRSSLARDSAVRLKEVLDRIELPPEEEWPDADQVAEEDLTKWTIPHTDITIVKIKEGPREGEFLFSADTVNRSREFYEIVEHLEYKKDREWSTPGVHDWFISTPGWMIPRSWIPSWAYARWYGQAIWQWIGLILVLLISFIVMGMIYLIGRRNATRFRSNWASYLMTLFFPITAMLVPLAARYLVIEQLQIFGYTLVGVTYCLHVIFLFALVILVVSLGGRLAEIIIATPWIKTGGLDAQLVRLTSRIVSLCGAAMVMLEGGRELGIPITTLAAGAGVGGLTLALAAQHSLKNILGSMMIMLDKPYRVGERILIKGYDGVVEDIGLRSTRIRSLSGHQVTIPNEQMAQAEIENIGRRPFIRQTATIEIPPDTPPTKIKRALEILRGILENHQGMDEEFPPRVYLRDFNDNSIGIFICFWFHPPEYWQFLAFSEQVMLKMTEQFEAAGITFAAPALTVRQPHDPDSPPPTSDS